MKQTHSAWGLFLGKKAYVVFFLCLAVPAIAPAQTFTTLHSFNGADGAASWAAVVQGTDGALYGTTDEGGLGGGGTVFRITTAGALTTIYNFCSQRQCADGTMPQGRLGETSAGDFYSTTTAGGLGDCTSGCGTIFEVIRNSSLITLDSFAGVDGADPADGLVPATNGDLYGTTVGGGDESCTPGGCGTVFNITPYGELTTLHRFTGGDGRQVYARLVQAADTDLYGTAFGGGSNACTFGCGTVYKITLDGTLTTLHYFAGSDGANPVGGLIQAADGNLYGETTTGGAYNGGTVFSITPSGALTTIYNFCSLPYCADGSDPPADVVQAPDGNFYGTTATGGAAGQGTIFKLTPDGVLTTLYNFCALSACADGADPQGGLVEATDGDFYGTTLLGGLDNQGTVFRLSVGFGPFIQTLPVMGAQGTAVEILGTDLTGAYRVTFNGRDAAFTVNFTGTGISTTVPRGATTGTVQVDTPGGTLQSIVQFNVLP